jgi:hypothetical protein
MNNFALTTRSGRLKVNIGAVLRTRMNTGVYDAAEMAVQCELREMGFGLSSIDLPNFY